MLHIHRAIAHRLDSIHKTRTLADEEIVLDQNSRDFLCRLTDKTYTSASVFAIEHSSRTSQVLMASREILTNHCLLVENSKKIAQTLYNIMLNKQNITPGFLFAVVAENEVGLFLALYKSELNLEYVCEYNMGQNGKMQVSLVANINSVPSARIPPHKCAFIHEKDEKKNYDALLVDNQVGRREEVSRFFYEDFLGCEILATTQKQTLDFCKAAEQWRFENNRYLKDQGLIAFYNALDRFLHRDIVDFLEFADAVLKESGHSDPNELTKKSLAEALAISVADNPGYHSNIPPTSFQPDKETATRLLSNTTLNLDGLKLIGPTEDVLGALRQSDSFDNKMLCEINPQKIQRDFRLS